MINVMITGNSSVTVLESSDSLDAIATGAAPNVVLTANANRFIVSMILFACCLHSLGHHTEDNDYN